MKDSLDDTVAPETHAPLRKCEWCDLPARRGGDLCFKHEIWWLDNISIPESAGHETEIHFGLFRAMGLIG